MNKFKIGMLVSVNPNNFGMEFMPGVGEIIKIFENDRSKTVYVCEHNGIEYLYYEEQIYEYEPY